jgi:hypothetical protein
MQMSMTGTKSSGLVSEVGLVTEVVFNRCSTVPVFCLLCS